MSRRIGSLLLVTFVALGGRALCPQGIGSCLKIETVRHDCCAGSAALSDRDCCCKGSSNSADAQDAAGATTTQLSTTAPAAGFVAVVAPPDAGVCALGSALPGSQQGPPGSLVSHHTVLLL